MTDIEELIKKIPKTELHLHIEGCLEPELMFKFAKRNNIEIPFKNRDEVKKAYKFTSKVMTENMMAMDAKEGISAFIEKRKPKWKNK